jgi:hypothetical protein
MEWWQIGLIVFGIIYSGLILAQIMNREKPVDKIQSILGGKPRDTQTGKRVTFSFPKAPTVSFTLYDLVVNFFAWIESCIYAVDRLLQNGIYMFYEWILSLLLVFLTKIGLLKTGLVI